MSQDQVALKPPERVTITGAGERTALPWLLHMQRKFPFAEWGLLLSPRGDSLRYPGLPWLQCAARVLGRDHISLHLCDTAVAGWLDGSSDVISLAEEFGRIQLNFNASRLKRPISDVMARIAAWGGPVILQVNEGNRMLLDAGAPANVSWLFDASGGTGKQPEDWPAAIPGAHCGWAGGLGPGNIAAELRRISEKARRNYWIDGEGRFRDEADQLCPKRVVSFFDTIVAITAPTAAA